MISLNEKPDRKFVYIRILLIASFGAAAMLALIAVFPSVFEPLHLPHPLLSEHSAANAGFPPPHEARNQRLANAPTVTHGGFVKDPYGCAYTFRYIDAQLSLTPVTDERKRPVCVR